MSVCSAYEKSILIGTAVFLFLYFVMMDIFLYQRFMRVNLVDEKLKNGEMLTVFRPLSVKMIMNDHVTHYLATPLSEALCYYTNFGVNFYYITPNVISFTHLCLGLLSARFVFSESLYRRRIGIVLYEVRSFLDAFDGTVYRSHANDKAYKSDHSNFGYWVDVVSDTLSGFALCFGILFCFWWKCPPRKSQSTSTIYHDSSNKWKINGSHTTIDLPEVKVNRRHDDYTKRYIFWRVFCFGLFWGLASSFWDQLVINYHHVFTTKPGAEHAVSTSLNIPRRIFTPCNRPFLYKAFPKVVTMFPFSCLFLRLSCT